MHLTTNVVMVYLKIKEFVVHLMSENCIELRSAGIEVYQVLNQTIINERLGYSAQWPRQLEALEHAEYDNFEARHAVIVNSPNNTFEIAGL